MQSIAGFVLLWLVAWVGLIILVLRKSVAGSQEEEESEGEAADEPIMPKYDHYWVRPDRASSLDQKIRVIRAEVRADGKGKCYNLNTGITEEHFPRQHAGISSKKIEIFLIPLKNKEVKEAGLLQHLDRFGLRPCSLDEAIDLSKVYGEIGRKTVFIAFGSVWEQSEENRLVPYFEFYGAVYGVYLGKDNKLLANSDDDCYAIAVRKNQ